MPLLVLFTLSLSVGIGVGLLAWRYPRIAGDPALPALDAARKVGETVGRYPRLRAILRARLDPAVATGLALTLALLLAVGGGVVLGVVAYLVRSHSLLVGLDSSAARWGSRHASATSMHVLNVVTQLGGISVVAVLCVVLAVAETIRERSVWVVPFIVAVIGGEEILTTAVKQLTDRLRPTFNPVAATLGPSFPSGHSATAAAFYATAALLLGRWRSRPARAVLAGLAVGIAVMVAASRVLLDVHWVTDVIAGLSLGWAWFALCAIAFGGRILRFGAAAEQAARAAAVTKAAGAAERPARVIKEGEARDRVSSGRR